MNTLAIMLSCSAVMSIISVFYIATTPILSKRYSSKWLYYIWLLVVFGWIFPFRPHLRNPIVRVQMPTTQNIQAKYNTSNEQLNFFANGSGGSTSVPLWLIILGIWAFGVIAIIMYHVWQHRRFIKMVNRWSEDITDQKLLHNLDTLKTELMINRHVDIKLCLSISTPMMIGFFHPTILLPSMDIASNDLEFILRHELIHLKRNDLWYKTLILLATAIHWFNPIVYFMARAIDVQCEISCDELLLKETSMQQRKQYGETLIGAIRNGVKMHTALSTDFYRDGNAIKTRIFRIMDTTKKSTGVILSCLVLTAVIGSGIAYASEKVIDLSNIKQNITINVNDLQGGIYYEGPFKLEEGDIIQYDITSGNDDKLVIDFKRYNAKNLTGCIKKLEFHGNNSGFPDYKIKVTKEMAGDYKIILGFTEGKARSYINGTIKIISGKEKA